MGYAEGRSRSDLDADAMLRDALVLQVQVIGEAASRVGADTRHAAPEIPWHELRAMRNRLVHEYFRVDLDLLWGTVERDLPALRRGLRELLGEGGR